MTTTTARTTLRILTALAIVAAAAVPADAQEFALFKGKVMGVWKSTFTVGGATRSGKPQTQLVGAGAGQGDNPEFPGASGGVGVNDDAQLNFPHRDELVSAPMTLTSELSLLHTSGQGVFLRVRAWYDMVLMGKNVPHGSGMNSYTANSRLVDKGNLGAAKFSGIDIYDAYYYGNFKAGGTKYLVRIGRQALDWGEGLFYPGINGVNAYDLAWATTTGARIANGGKLPVNRLYGNVALPGGLTVDAFYNLEFRSTVMPGCATYFSGLDNGFHPGCNLATAAGLPDKTALLVKTKTYYNGKLGANGVFPNGGPDAANATRAPDWNSGWGVSGHKFLERIKTELGVYYADFTNPFPINSPVVGTDALTFAINTHYEPVKAWAVSAGTGVRNAALGAQLTRFLGYPSQRNAPAFIEGSLSGIGPYGFMKTDYVGREAPGYFPLNITQLQYGGIWQIGRVIGRTDTTLIGEAQMQWNTNLPPIDGPDAERLVRAGNFGLASWNQQGYVCDPGPLSNGIINSCELDGFTTPFAMGYKLRLQTNVPVKPGVTLTPALTFGHDITGFSGDFAITGGRVTYGAFLRMDVRNVYFLELGGSWYRRGTTYDSMRDRGQYTFVWGYNLR